jgi:hypothetical protein
VRLPIRLRHVFDYHDPVTFSLLLYPSVFLFLFLSCSVFVFKSFNPKNISVSVIPFLDARTLLLLRNPFLFPFCVTSVTSIVALQTPAPSVTSSHYLSKYSNSSFVHLFFNYRLPIHLPTPLVLSSPLLLFVHPYLSVPLLSVPQLHDCSPSHPYLLFYLVAPVPLFLVDRSHCLSLFLLRCMYFSHPAARGLFSALLLHFLSSRVYVTVCASCVLVFFSTSAPVFISALCATFVYDARKNTLLECLNPQMTITNCVCCLHYRCLVPLHTPRLLSPLPLTTYRLYLYQRSCFFAAPSNPFSETRL